MKLAVASSHGFVRFIRGPEPCRLLRDELEEDPNRAGRGLRTRVEEFLRLGRARRPRLGWKNDAAAGPLGPFGSRGAWLLQQVGLDAERVCDALQVVRLGGADVERLVGAA